MNKLDWLLAEYDAKISKMLYYDVVYKYFISF